MSPQSLALIFTELLKSLASCQCTKIKLLKLLKRDQFSCPESGELMLTKKERKTQKHQSDKKAEVKLKKELLKSQNPYMIASLEKEMTFTIPITVLVAVMVSYIN